MSYLQNSAKLPAHIPRIDVLRAYAIIMVFAIHFASHVFGLVLWNGLFRDYVHSGPYVNYGLVPFTCGWAGVALFFVISGFCIHYGFLLRKDESLHAGDFFWRRFARLYPAYFISLVTFVIVDYIQDLSLVTTWGIVSHIFLIHNFFANNFTSINGVYWSLGVECQFYLLYPLLLLIRRKYSLSFCLVISLATNMVCYIVFIWLSPNSGSHMDVYRGFPFMIWCDWILGACVAEAFVTGKRCFRHEKFFFHISLGLFLLAINFKPLIGEAFLFASVTFAIILQEYIGVQEPLNWREKCLIPVGLVSYSFYLWHGLFISPMQNLIHHFLGVSEQSIGMLLLAYLPLNFLAIFLFSILSYYVLEIGPRRFLLRHPFGKEPRSKLRGISEVAVDHRATMQNDPRPAIADYPPEPKQVSGN